MLGSIRAKCRCEWGARDRTYQEVRFLRDKLLAEAVARKLNIILEDPGLRKQVEAWQRCELTDVTVKVSSTRHSLKANWKR